MARRRPVDRALGIETTRKVRAPTGPGAGPLARQARDYEPTPPEILEALLTEVRLPYEDLSFVDLGAGKGRVLCLAASHPFRAVVGVELFESLAAVARENLGRLPSDWVRAQELQCVTGDAGEFPLPAGPKVVFMYNPFGPRVLSRVLAGLEAERTEAGGPPLYLLYYEPVHAGVMVRPWLGLRREESHWGVWVSPEAP
ncbi:MAG: methyltransferase domain-containing protein [Myxococcota bacterium]